MHERYKIHRNHISIMDSTDSSSGSQHPHLPPGFRFHPTDEELVVHYLKRKASSAPLPVAIIADVDLYKFDPWELPSMHLFRTPLHLFIHLSKPMFLIVVIITTVLFAFSFFCFIESCCNNCKTVSRHIFLNNIFKDFTTRVN